MIDQSMRDMAKQGFDVIDTSNLLDHLGLPNVLCAIVPLLSHSPRSVAYTERLMMFDKDDAGLLDADFGADIATMSILLGISSMEVSTGVTANSNISDRLGLRVQRLKTDEPHEAQLYYRTCDSWTRPNSDFSKGDQSCTSNQRYGKPQADTNDVSSLFLAIYRGLYATEDNKRLCQTF